MSEDRNNNIIWFLAGLGLGAASAVLFAPNSGRETREAIVTGVDDARKHLVSLGQSAREHVSDLIASGKKIVVGAKRHANAASDADGDALRKAAGEKHS